jgi:dipeptidyl aminopeptidase/acylaminoacyl peptidase
MLIAPDGSQDRGTIVGVRILPAPAALLAVGLLAACSDPPAHPTVTGTATARASASAAPSPTPALSAYAIESLRARSYRGGTLQIGARTGGTAAYTTRRVTWPSQGGTMTGLADIPAGAGPFPVVIVNHGYIPASAYQVGQDSTKYADALAAAGMLTVSPDYPGYAGSSPPEPDLVMIEAEAVSSMDLIGALSTLPQADTRRIAVAGHSNGGGVSELMMVIDPRIRAVVLYAPVSTDMADNAHRFWSRRPGGPGLLGTPEDNPVAYAQISPRGHLRADGPPVLILQGTLDEDIPAEWTAATVAALQAKGVQTRFVSFPGAHHNFAGADLARANGLAVDWIRGALP